MATVTAAYVAMEDGFPGDDLFDHIEDLLDFPNDDILAEFGLPDACGASGVSNNSTVVMSLPTLPHLSQPLPLSVEDNHGGLFGGCCECDDAGDLLGGGGGGGRGEESLDGLSSNTKAGAGAEAFSHGQEQRHGPSEEIEIIPLEWVSQFLEESDSMSLDLPNCKNDTVAKNINAGKSGREDSFFRTSSPVSVLEHSSLGGSAGGGSSSPSLTSSYFSSSSSSSAPYFGSNPIYINSNASSLVSTPDPILQAPCRARSKRPRPATFSPRPHAAIPFLAPSSDAPAMQHHPSIISSDAESFGGYNPAPLKNKNNNKKKKKNAFTAIDGEKPGSPPPVRKCMHCQITKTPQWRAGPMGPKTLCNACGVRYKSGRLFPEYRPAASPTFIPSLHSNSHKKVVEMRIKTSQRATANGSSESANWNSCDLLEYIRSRRRE